MLNNSCTHSEEDQSIEVEMSNYCLYVEPCQTDHNKTTDRERQRCK